MATPTGIRVKSKPKSKTPRRSSATRKPLPVVKRSDTAPRVYTLDVFIWDGPVAGEFRGKVISRRIQIRGDQTLEDLHYAIFDAFDRWEQHMYEFNFGEGPHDRSALYVLPGVLETAGEDEGIKGGVKRTTIDSLGLTKDRAFGYLFDYGDDWQHQINVVVIGKPLPRHKYPKVTKRVGKSPPQYAELDEDE